MNMNMNIFEAIVAMRKGQCVRRSDWPGDKFLFWKNDTIHLNDPAAEKYEVRLDMLKVESALATDWVIA